MKIRNVTHRTRLSTRRLSPFLLATAGASLLGSATMYPSPAAAATTDPSTSTPPGQGFQQTCWAESPNPMECDRYALANIDRAHRREGLGPLSLPSNFYQLSLASQVIAVANAERTIRALPAMGENATYDAEAQQGAARAEDPTGPSGYTWGSNWAWGEPTALAADYTWMYDDGPGSQNIDCTSTNHSGCWVHRNNILSPWAGSAGAGGAAYDGRLSLTQLFVK